MLTIVRTVNSSGIVWATLSPSYMSIDRRRSQRTDVGTVSYQKKKNERMSIVSSPRIWLFCCCNSWFYCNYFPVHKSRSVVTHNLTPGTTVWRDYISALVLRYVIRIHHLKTIFVLKRVGRRSCVSRVASHISTEVLRYYVWTQINRCYWRSHYWRQNVLCT